MFTLILQGITLTSTQHTHTHTRVVFGHKIPDTDAICAAISYQWELQERGINARAYRLGELNPETAYVLKALNEETPPLLENLSVGLSVDIVDTNNPLELPEGIDRADVHSVCFNGSGFGVCCGRA